MQEDSTHVVAVSVVVGMVMRVVVVRVVMGSELMTLLRLWDRGDIRTYVMIMRRVIVCKMLVSVSVIYIVVVFIVI